MAYDVIKEATALYKGIDRSTLEEEELVCECARVSLKTIQDVIRINNLTTVQEITDYTKAGAFCKSCVKPGGHEKRKYYLEDILKETRAKMDSEKTTEKSFSEMSLFQKGKALENFFDAEIRPMLQKDGGNVEIVDLAEKEGKTLLTISYLGACLGCASSMSGTFNAIEMIIKEKLTEEIEVTVQQ